MIDYTCLGQNTEMRERRYDVLALFIKGATPQETHKILSKQKHPKLTLKQVYNDRLFFTTNPLHNLPAEMARDFNLEVRLDVFKPDSKSWIATQELIRKYKADSLKLQGLMNDKVEHSGDVTIRYAGEAIDGDSNPIPAITPTKDIPQTKNKV